jgi:spore maturation protein CgeB
VLGEATGVTAFYDIDTPVTLAALDRGTCEYLVAPLAARFDLYLSFTGGPTLAVLSERHGVARPRAFHCLVDPEAYQPVEVQERWHLGYLGTYSVDRQPALDELLVEPARRRPDVERIDHLAPAEHAAFYAAQRLTLNITRADMVQAGWSPSVRLFEAGACAVPVVSDRWEGLHSFFADEDEILTASCADDVLRHLERVDRRRRDAVGRAARRRVLAEHTAAHRVAELEAHVAEVSTSGARG